MHLDGKTKNLGRFATYQEAEQVYLKAKYKRIMKIAFEQIDIRIKNGLIKHASVFYSQIILT